MNFSNNQLDADGMGIAITAGALAAGGIQSALGSQTASSAPMVHTSSVPASPLWNLVIMSFALFMARLARLIPKA